MRAAAPRTGQDQVERKVIQLHGSGLSDTHLRLGAEAVLAQKLPLRDAPVLREARRLEAMTSPEAVAAWGEARQWIKAAVKQVAWDFYLSPLELIGSEGTTLLLAGGGWVTRYSALIREALQVTGSGYTDVEFVSAGEGASCP